MMVIFGVPDPFVSEDVFECAVKHFQNDETVVKIRWNLRVMFGALNPLVTENVVDGPV